MYILSLLLQILAVVIPKVVFVLAFYQIVIALFGLRRKNDKKIYEPTKSFALVIAAHNEETVIQYIVKSLNNLDYPKELFDIFVIADNCTDKTAERGREAGAEVFERFNKEKRGKGYALEWMFDKIFKMEKKYDSIVIFDADNLASRNFLSEMNNKLCDGYKVVQGYLDSKNPKDSWIAASYSIAFWLSNRITQLSRQNLNLSAQLGGTGFCIDTSILKRLGWGATCLTEDLEFTCKLIINGEKVGWAHDAVIYDEKPLTLNQSWWQRKRWMQGFGDVADRYFFKLMKKGIKERSWTIIDCALYSIQPYTFILMGLSYLVSIYNYAYAIANDNFIKVFNYQDPAFIALFILTAIFFVGFTPFVMSLDKKVSAKVLLYYILFPIYGLTWIPIAIQGLANKKNKDWSHTAHTRTVDISDLENVN